MISKRQKIVFMGTPQFAVPSLELLVSNGYNVVGVYTQPDRPSNRNKLVYGAVKHCAINHNLAIYQFDKIKSPEGVDSLRELEPDIVVTAAFGQLLTQKILDIPTHGIYNIHASLLPKYRGGCPIQWCIVDGNDTTGISIMKTERGLDTGPILLQTPLSIDINASYDQVYTELSRLGALCLLEFLTNFAQLVPIPQDHSQASHQRLLTKQDGKVDWSKSSLSVHNHIRGVTSNPGAYTAMGLQNIKIIKTHIVASCDYLGQVGQVVNVDSSGIIVQCGSGHIAITQLQLPNKKPISVGDFLRGNKLDIGTVFG